VTRPHGRGTLLALEGGEASGKSTQAARLAARLGAVLTREPGGTDLGERVRTLLLDPDGAAVGPRAEALLMAAARAQHVDEVIRPALEQGRTVVTDRYVGSSLAYQGHGRGLPLDDVAALSAFAVSGVAPDVVVLLAVPPEVAAARLTGRPDRLESLGDAFHQRVAAGFDVLAAADPAHWLVVDGVGDPDDVEARLWAAIAPRLVRPEV
jgi:dTMP kinase